MSKWSGKCDCYDDMMITCEKELPRKLNEDEINYELRCLDYYIQKKLHFKIYQSFKLKLDEFNIDKEIELANNPALLSKEEYTIEVPDKRSKTGKRIIKKCKYKYFGREYDKLSDINYTAKREISLFDPLDFVKYYTYIPSAIASSPEGIIIHLSDESYLDEKYKNYRESGIDTTYLEENMRELKIHYITLILAKYTKSFNDICKLSGSTEELEQEARFKYRESFEKLFKSESEDLMHDYQFSSGYLEGVTDTRRLFKKNIEKLVNNKL